MKAPPCFVASDMHVGAAPPSSEAAVVRWLDHVAREAGSLVLVGDIFDFWFEYRRVILRDHFRVLAALRRVVEAGVPVTYLGGNHDWWGGSFLEDDVGVAFHRDPVELELGGRRLLAAHGDGLGRGDLGYRILRILLRSRLTRRAFRWIHPDVGARIADAVSGTEAREGSGSGPTPDERARAAFLEEWARERLEADPELDGVLVGHAHVPAVTEVEPGRFYLNAGDWIHHRSYLVLVDGEPPRLERWEG